MFLLYNQVQDYYVCLKFNRGDKCILALYRLFVASCMLHKVKVPGRSHAHNYPKIQLTYLLILQHWKDTRFCARDMMVNNMAIFNEELGEIGFSILSRAVLGDHTTDDFDHLNKVYSMIPVYRDIKKEVLQDNALPSSLSWRHKINTQGDEVLTTGLHFKKLIRQIVAGTHRSYHHQVNLCRNATVASQNLVPNILDTVLMSQSKLCSHVDELYRSLQQDIHCDFLYRFHNIWPEAKVDVDDPDDVSFTNEEVNETDVTYEEKEQIQTDVELSCEDHDVTLPSDCLSPISNASDHEEVKNNQSLNKSWNSWGTIHEENCVVGPRSRALTTLYLPSKRRIFWRTPKELSESDDDSS